MKPSPPDNIATQTTAQPDSKADSLDLAFYARSLMRNSPAILAKSLAVGLLALGATYLVTPTFTGRTSFLLQQGSQSPAAAAMASLGSLSNLAGAAAGVRTLGDQYLALMRSVNVQDRIVDKFKLMELYDAKFKVEARTTLSKNARFTLGKKEGLIIVEVDDHDPKRAADIANEFVIELERLSSQLTLTEAQQRRAFYEARLREASDRLRTAQVALQASGFDSQSIKAEPKATAESFARLAAEASTAEIRLQALRRTLTESAPEVQGQAATVAALHGKLAKMGSPQGKASEQSYVSLYREFKYQETLFEMFSKQYELARLDEAREGSPIQLIDLATPPEIKSSPKRAMTAALATCLALALFAGMALIKTQGQRR